MAADVARRSRPGPLLALGQVRYQLLLLLLSPLGFFITLVISLLLLISLNVAHPGGPRYAQFLTPAVSAFCLLNACYVTTVTSMVLAREEGILKRLRGTPLPAWTYLGGRSGSALVTSVVSVAIIIATGVAFFHVIIVWRAMGYFAAAAGLGIVCTGAKVSAGRVRLSGGVSRCPEVERPPPASRRRRRGGPGQARRAAGWPRRPAVP